jgi:hypothetical protein
MVNENFDKFNKIQQAHKSNYPGSDKKQSPGINDAEYNNQNDTDISVGSTGRNENLK